MNTVLIYVLASLAAATARDVRRIHYGRDSNDSLSDVDEKLKAKVPAKSKRNLTTSSNEEETTTAYTRTTGQLLLRHRVFPQDGFCPVGMSTGPILPILEPLLTNLEIFPREVLCKFQLNAYACQDQELGGEITIRPKYYYDIKMEDCVRGQVTDQCPSSGINAFSHLRDCQEACRTPGIHQITTDLKDTPEAYCRLQPDFGFCNNYNPKYYFDLTHRACRGFSWSGCGGNLNRFNTEEECMSKCLPKIKYDPGKV